MQVTIKTLDSQNHQFELEDDITVRQFKDKIAERISVSADRQRLIYCGRVLNDEKPLKDYDVNGKVVHLVQREPPSSRPPASSGGSSTGPTRRARSSGDRSADGTASFLRQLESLDGNMVLGGMMIPMTAEAAPPSAMPSLNPSSTLCMNRITVARHMLNCVNNIIAYLENPSIELNNSEMDILSHQTMESTIFEVGISAVGISAVPQQDMRNFVQAFQGVVSDAFRQNGISNISVQQQNDPQTTMPTVQVYGNVPSNQMLADLISGAVRAAENSVSGGAAAAASAAAATTTPAATTTTSTTSSTGAAAASASTAGGASASAASNRQTTSPTVLAEVVQQMRDVQRRMEPFVQAYYDILQNEPAFEEADTAGRENSQRIYDRVSEALHYMSHAQHAISDLSLDLSTTSPRHLCCRPMLVEQSAYLSSGIASVPNNIIRLNGNAPNNNNNNNNESGNIGIFLAQSQSSDDSSSSPRDDSPENNANATATAQQQGQSDRNEQFVDAPNPSQSIPSRVTRRHRIYIPIVRPRRINRPANTQHMQVARLIQAVVNSAPMNADVHVQINAGTSGTSASNLSGPQQNTATTNTSSETCNHGSGGDGPRVTSITLPTTSTQTRSTARPQMHLTGGGIPGRNLRPIPASMLSSFDRFLPCNSHHIRELPSTSGQARAQGQTQGQAAQPAQPPNRSRPSTRSRLSFIEQLMEQQSANRATSTTQTEAAAPAPSAPHSVDDTPIPLFGTQLTLRDFMNISSNAAPLNAIQQNLLQYMQTVLGATVGNQPNFEMLINIPIINQLLSMLPQYDLPGFNTRASVENLIRESAIGLMDALTAVHTATADVNFGATIVDLCTGFIRKLFTLLIICQGRENAERCLETISQLTVVAAENVSALQILLRYFMNVVRLQLDEINGQSSSNNTSEVATCLVTREQPVAAAAMAEASPMETDEPIETPKPMAVDSAPTSPTPVVAQQPDKPSTSSTPAPVVEKVATAAKTPESNTAPLPNVMIGCEPWHSNFPNEWIPIITRDVVRQRTQSPQRPYSDAYISGMSSKRRKLITSTKLPTDVPTLLADGVREAVRTSGVSSANVNVEEMAASIAADPVTNASYREALKENIKERLKKDPDFDPDKFPNSAKFTEK